jgi:hypothetical protein
VGVRNVPLKNCFGLFQAATGRLRIKAKYPECQGLAAGRRHSASDFPHKNSNDNDTNGEQGKEPARAHMLLFDRY